MFRTFATAFMALALTAPAIAAEPGGTVTGTIEGQQVELSIWPEHPIMTGISKSAGSLFLSMRRDRLCANGGLVPFP